MTETIYIIIAIFCALLIGAYLGKLFNSLKTKGQNNALTERNTNLKEQLDVLKSQSKSEQDKQNKWFEEQLDTLKSTINKVEIDRESIRREKDFLN